MAIWSHCLQFPFLMFAISTKWVLHAWKDSWTISLILLLFLLIFCFKYGCSNCMKNGFEHFYDIYVIPIPTCTTSCRSLKFSLGHFSSIVFLKFKTRYVVRKKCLSYQTICDLCILWHNHVYRYQHYSRTWYNVKHFATII